MYTVLGMWHAPLETFLEFRGMKLLMRPFLAQYDAIQSPDDSFTCMNIYPFHPLHYTAAAHYQPCVDVRRAMMLSKTRE